MMDPALLHSVPTQNQTQNQQSPSSVHSSSPLTLGNAASANPNTSTSSDDVKPSLPAPGLVHRDSTGGNVSDSSSHSDGEDDDRGDGDGAKRPRLRLAHACDRCRKRKIRCDTQQPCGPCQATRNECTFNTPSRRVTKPKGGGSENRSSSTSGIKRPHSPPGSARIAALGGEGQANLEARLAALEAMLGDVPPKVHNAFLSSLDARLGSGGGVGISGGKGEGVSVALEALAGGNFGNLSSMLSGNGWNGTGGSNLTPGWASGSGTSNGAGFAGRALRGGDINDITRKMEGMSFFYEDEIGQAKWQGESPTCLVTRGIGCNKSWTELMCRRDIWVPALGFVDGGQRCTRNGRTD